MKILCVIDSLGSGGAQRQIVELAKGFKEKGFNVSFLVYHEGNFFKDELNAVNVAVTLIPEPSYIKRLFKVRRYIRKGKYDVVLSFLEAASFMCEFAGWPSRNWKLIVGERSANPKIATTFKGRFYRWMHFFADFAVANSYENIRLVKNANPYLPNKKCKVIYNLVDNNYWQPPLKYIPHNNGKLNIVVAASHQYLKNAYGLIEAVKLLNAKDRCKLIVNWYGDEAKDDSFKEAKELIEKYGLQEMIIFHKATKNILSKIQQCDIVALFSKYEGLPNIVCEGMMVGKPIISSYVSDLRIFLKHNLNLVFDPNNISDITRALNYVLSLNEEDLLSLGKRNEILANQLFEKNHIISEYISLFSQ